MHSRMSLARLLGIGADPEHAERHRHRPTRAPLGDVDQLQAAAAEVAGNAVGVGDAGHHAEAGQRRFLLGAQHLAGQAEPLDPGDQVGAVAGVARRGGGDDVGGDRAHVVDEQLEPPERLQRVIARLVGDRAGFGQAGAEPGQHLFVEDRERHPLRARINDEANRVGADVDDRDRLAGHCFAWLSGRAGSAAWAPGGPSSAPGRGRIATRCS